LGGLIDVPLIYADGIDPDASVEARPNELGESIEEIRVDI
jgi:hypothetical protein